MKLKVITIGLALLTGAVIGLKSVFNAPTDEYKGLLLENIEALAQEENETGIPDCWGEGSVNCPKEEKTSERVKYFSLRDKVSLY